MPAATEIGFLVRLLDDLHQFRMVIHALHVRVNVQRAEAAGKILLLVRRQAMLAAQNNHLVIQESLMDLIEIGIGQPSEQVCSMDFGTQSARQAVNGEGHEPK